MQVLAGVGAGHDGQLSGGQVEFANPSRFQQRHERERLDARAEGDRDVRVAGGPEKRAGRVHLDHVPAVDALDDVAADVAGQDRGRPT